MYSFRLFARSALFFAGLPHVLGTLYITHPLTSTTCTGGKQCTVTWVDDGVAPTLGAIGPCHVGLYNDNGVLVQQIPPVDVASVHSLVFTPDPEAGPDSSKYYINFTSVDPTKGYHEFSTFFTLDGMSGSLSHPNPSDTSAISVPSSVASPASQSITTTITVGLPSPSVSVSSSGSVSSGQATSQSNNGSGSASPAIPPSASSSAIISTPSVSPSQAVSSPVSPSLATPPSSFITIRTSAASSPPSATTLVVPPPPSTLNGPFFTVTTNVPAPSTAADSSQTNGGSGTVRGRSAGLTAVYMGTILTVMWTCI